MLREYPIFKRHQSEKIYKHLDSKEKEVLENYLKYRQARGLESKKKVDDVKRRITQFVYTLGKDYKDLFLPIKKENKPIKTLRDFLSLLNNSSLKNTTKNDIKVDLKNFLKFRFSDWSLRFSNLDDIKTSTIRNEQRINPSILLKKEDVEKCMKQETRMFWKAFLITQYEAGLRTGEARALKWDDVKFNIDDEISEINIYATKTKKARSVFVKEATFYLKKLKEQQENTKTLGVYVFHSKKELNEPIDKTSVSKWFKVLTLNSLGRECWSYLLRHSRGTELYKLARENKISRDTAQGFMGHSKDMSYVYEHLDSDTIKEMLKNQVYKLEELPQGEKDKFQKQIEELQKKINEMDKRFLKAFGEEQVIKYNKYWEKHKP